MFKRDVEPSMIVERIILTQSVTAIVTFKYAKIREPDAGDLSRNATEGQHGSLNISASLHPSLGKDVQWPASFAASRKTDRAKTQPCVSTNGSWLVHRIYSFGLAQ